MYRWKRLIIVSCSALVVLAILAVVFIHYMNEPSQGSVSNNLSPLPSQVSSFDSKPVNVVGKYINFSYPAAMIPNTNIQTSVAVPESYLYQYKDVQTWVLAISVNKLNQPNLSQDSGYSSRKLDPSRYQESTLAVGAKTYYIFKDTSEGNFDEVAFILNGNLSADISLYGDDGAGFTNLQNTFNMVLDTLQWKS